MADGNHQIAVRRDLAQEACISEAVVAACAIVPQHIGIFAVGRA